MKRDEGAGGRRRTEMDPLRELTNEAVGGRSVLNRGLARVTSMYVIRCGTCLASSEVETTPNRWSLGEGQEENWGKIWFSIV